MTVGKRSHFALLPSPSEFKRVLQGLIKVPAGSPTSSTTLAYTATAKAVSAASLSCFYWERGTAAVCAWAAQTIYAALAGDFEVLAVELYMMKTSWD